jgi:hypothetical protein
MMLHLPPPPVTYIERGQAKGRPIEIHSFQMMLLPLLPPIAKAAFTLIISGQDLRHLLNQYPHNSTGRPVGVNHGSIYKRGTWLLI